MEGKRANAWRDESQVCSAECPPLLDSSVHSVGLTAAAENVCEFRKERTGESSPLQAFKEDSSLFESIRRCVGTHHRIAAVPAITDDRRIFKSDPDRAVNTDHALEQQPQISQSVASTLSELRSGRSHEKC